MTSTCVHVVELWKFTESIYDITVYYLNFLFDTGGRHSESESKSRLPMWSSDALFLWSGGKMLCHNSKLGWGDQLKSKTKVLGNIAVHLW